MEDKFNKNREVTPDNIKYGILVEVDTHGSTTSYHSGMKVHFFNKKGALIGNLYQFVSYDKIRFRREKKRYYPLYFNRQVFSNVKMKFFRILLFITTKLIRFTQKYMD